MEMECHAKFSWSTTQTRQMVNVINKLWQLNVCCKTYCSTTIQQLNTESQKIGAQTGPLNFSTPIMVSTLLMPGHNLIIIHNYCIFYSILQSWWKNLSYPCTGIIKVAVNL